MTRTSTVRPCSEQVIALAVAAGGYTDSEVRKVLGNARSQGWDDRRWLREVVGMLLRGETLRDLNTAITKGLPQ